jgi:GNAT superfamily N-acetyltransferase
MDDFSIRAAEPADVPAILALVIELARHERLEHEVTATKALIHQALFGAPPRAFAHLCDHAGEPVGLALCYYTFSTFLGRHGIYVEDVFVQPEHRKRGIGRALFRRVAQQALAEGCGRIEWSVLDWNETALRFYAGLGAQAMSESQLQRLSGAALDGLAA